ncbi:MMPL family transporter [soil metagenome]
MWKSLAKFVLKNRFTLLVLLAITTGIMGYFASKVKLSYEFSKAIPTDNPRYQEYLAFKKTFGDDGNLLVVGINSKDLFVLKNFTAYRQLLKELKQVKFVEDVLSVPGAVALQKDSAAEKLTAQKIFPDTIRTQQALDSAAAVFFNLPFYRSLLYNDSAAYLMGVRINKDVLNSPGRSKVVAEITNAVNRFSAATTIETHLSGLPLIRTVVADRIQQEMKLFLFGSLALSVLILLIFFRSISTTLISLAVVIIGVIWTVAVTYLCGYNITLLTALIPSLVVVIGIPNCIYFINKYHTSYLHDNDPSENTRKTNALVNMVSKMGVVTLFCNLTAAIGFAVFALTKSAILKEFGVVAGISIMIIFVVSFILLPSVLSYLPAPKEKQLKYLNNKWINLFLTNVEAWTFNHKKTVLAITAVVVVFSVFGMLRLRSEGHIVDDLPKTDKIYTDLKFFEHNFKGVMPLEIVVDTKKRNGLTGMRALAVYEKVDSLAQYISAQPDMNRPLSVAEGLKFAKQGFYENDSTQYLMPNSFDGSFVGEYLRPSKSDSSRNNNFSRMLNSFMDSSKQRTRISVSMADVGTVKLPAILAGIQKRAYEVFDSSRYFYYDTSWKGGAKSINYVVNTSIGSDSVEVVSSDTTWLDSSGKINYDLVKVPQYKVVLTGTSITFLEGSRFIINGLKESILWAFLLIALCMLYLFRSFRILICSLIPNIIPLLVTAGIMGWAGVPLKPSTVLIFSVALGIAVDITIRFLVNYKQDLPLFDNDVAATVKSTVQQTGLSIVYTSMVLTAGFIIFCASSFGGTFALGWLTSVTLFVATITNLVLLPVLLLLLNKKKKP